MTINNDIESVCLKVTPYKLKETPSKEETMAAISNTEPMHHGTVSSAGYSRASKLQSKQKLNITNTLAHAMTAQG
jgi:hypothetical protein